MRRRSAGILPTGTVLDAPGNFPGLLAIENNEGYICGGLPYGRRLNKH